MAPDRQASPSTSVNQRPTPPAPSARAWSASAPGPHPGATDGSRVVTIPSVCRMCNNGCGILIHRLGDYVVKIEGNPANPHNFGTMCAKGRSALIAQYDPQRLRVPLRRTNPRKGPGQDPGWRELPYEEATDEIVARMRKILQEDPRKLMFANGIGDVDTPRQVCEALARAFGTPNFTAGVFFGTHTRSSYLTTGAMHTEPDLELCNYLILFGSQKGMVAGHDTMKSARAMAEALHRGMKLVVFDPVCSASASKAHEWIPLLPGTDGAVALAMLHVILNELQLWDEPFLANQSNAPYLVAPDGHYVRHPVSGKPLVWDLEDDIPREYDAADLARPALVGSFQVEGQPCHPALDCLRQHVAQFPPERVELISTVPAATLRRVATEFAEAAQIGSTITLDGHQLPFRPVCAFSDSRGSTCHADGLWTGTAIQLLDAVVGAVDMPGGSISANLVGPNGRPRVKAGPDGIIQRGSLLTGGETQYPGQRPRKPETLELHELFPIGRQPRPMLGLTLLEYEHLLPYKLEMLVVWATNVLMSGADPRRMAQAFEKIPFVVALGERLDETAECADLVLPIPSSLERLDFPMNSLDGWVTGKHWYFAARQPAVDPPPGVRHQTDIFLDWAERLGLLPQVNELLNEQFNLKPEYRLDSNRRYTNQELTERRMQSMFGADHDLAWFREHGLVAWERPLAERYPRAVLQLPRVPVYFPHVPDRGRELRAVLDELGLDWDLSLYQPLPTWPGCWSHRSRQPEHLFGVNYKLPFLTSTTTQGNAWLMNLAERHPYAQYVVLNPRAAAARGISDGDEVEIEGTNGYVARGLARVSEIVHPDVAAIASCFGHWARGQPLSYGKGVHYNAFIPLDIQGMEMLSADYDLCALLTIRKVGTGRGRN